METTNFYNKLAAFYPVVDIFLKGQKLRLIAEVNKRPTGRLLEIGVGNGKHLKYYKNHFVTGIDSSPAMIKIARRQARTNTDIIEMNGESLLFPQDSFDYVVLSHVIAVVDEPDRLLQETFKVLKPGGSVFILNHFTPGNWLKYVDKTFRIFSAFLHFRSVFRLSDLAAIRLFEPEDEISFGKYGYFKLLIFRKP
jgi:phosphatidylethanolamine/phosphatidyl-N-methylethanolamine N-methyltransferase